MLDKFGTPLVHFHHRFGPAPVNTALSLPVYDTPTEPDHLINLRYLDSIMPGQPLYVPREKGLASSAGKRRITALKEPRGDSDAANKLYVEKVASESSNHAVRTALELLAGLLQTKTLQEALTIVLSAM